MNKYSIKNYKHKKQVIQHLIDLGNYKIEPETTFSGICTDLVFALDNYVDGHELVQNLSKGWPHHTGKCNLPVSLNYRNCNWRRDSTQGRRRRELCLYLAKELGKLRLSYKGEIE